jgi:hypothetical protein
MLLAAFMFPVALMFLVTGALYTWGVKGSYEDRNISVALSEPLRQDAETLRAIAAAELSRQGVALPTGNAKVESLGGAYRLTWTGSRRDVLLQPTGNPLEARLTIKETSWYRTFVQLHKAKGGALFKVYAAVFALALFILLASGFVMAWQVPAFRRNVKIATGAGIVVFLAMLASG